MTAQSSLAASARGVVMEFTSGQDRIRVLHGVDMDLPYGRMTFLTGPSGSGKTTMLSILSGTLSPTSGEISVMGERLDKMSSGALVKFRRRRIGFIFQQYNLVATLTASENAAIPLIADGLAWDKATKRAKDLLAQLGLQDHLNKLPRQMSGGQQQRVAIARALVHAPALVVCDEPTAALDAAAGQAVMQLLVEAAKDTHRAVLVVTHDDRIYRYADRMLQIEDGRILGETTTRLPQESVR
ncbi:MAG: ABC transporter ATP-binding protein [Caulobacterales bacterium]|jgi:putative ABC transport system ATP-binding protein